jgi:hypothetical protein
MWHMIRLNAMDDNPLFLFITIFLSLGCHLPPLKTFFIVGGRKSPWGSSGALPNKMGKGLTIPA